MKRIPKWSSILPAILSPQDKQELLFLFCAESEKKIKAPTFSGALDCRSPASKEIVPQSSPSRTIGAYLSELSKSSSCDLLMNIKSPPFLSTIHLTQILGKPCKIVYIEGKDGVTYEFWDVQKKALPGFISKGGLPH
ncbi:hypothetical protein [Brevibacillus reuszeri]|uniref:hypothetical protein n=1 Tax=Brevibacillus reuszeri TaxID=54915 RepID=UPI001BB45791|nr:hypothetical protein [Brevibacillus reuszeri]